MGVDSKNPTPTQVRWYWCVRPRPVPIAGISHRSLRIRSDWSLWSAHRERPRVGTDGRPCLDVSDLMEYPVWRSGPGARCRCVSKHQAQRVTIRYADLTFGRTSGSLRPCWGRTAASNRRGSAFDPVFGQGGRGLRGQSRLERIAVPFAFAGEITGSWQDGFLLARCSGFQYSTRTYRLRFPSDFENPIPRQPAMTVTTFMGSVCGRSAA